MSFLATVAVGRCSAAAASSCRWPTTPPSPPARASTAHTPLTYVVGVVGYLLITFVVTFFAAALVAGARERLLGGNPTLGSAFAVAARPPRPIFLWSLLTGTVGSHPQHHPEAGPASSARSSSGPSAWPGRSSPGWPCPVIVVEGTGPITSLKRSAALFRQTWGENLIGQVGFGLVGFVFMVPGLVDRRAADRHFCRCSASSSASSGSPSSRSCSAP